jgi:hypothetical protein
MDEKKKSEEFKEVKIRIIDEEGKVVVMNHAIYDEFKFSRYDPLIAKLIKELVDSEKENIETVKVTASMVVK